MVCPKENQGERDSGGKGQKLRLQQSDSESETPGRSLKNKAWERTKKTQDNKRGKTGLKGKERRKVSFAKSDGNNGKRGAA